MNAILILLNKYGIYFHVLSIIFWIYIIWMNLGFMHDGTLATKHIVSISIAAFFILLSIFNIYTWNKKHKAN